MINVKLTITTCTTKMMYKLKLKLNNNKNNCPKTINHRNCNDFLN